MASTYSELGALYDLRTEYAKAADQYRAAAGLAHELGLRGTESAALTNLGDALRNANRFDEALQVYTQVLAFDREVGDAANERIDHHRLGDLHLRLDRLAEARAEYELALGIARELGNASVEGIALQAIAGVQARMPGERPAARATYAQAIEAYRRAGDRAEESAVLAALGVMAIQDGDLAAASRVRAAVPRNRQGVEEPAPCSDAPHRLRRCLPIARTCTPRHCHA